MPTTVKVVSNQKMVVAKLDAQVRRSVQEQVLRLIRIVQEEMRRPKTGKVYGEETEVTFSAKGGGEREVKFQTLQRVKSKSSAKKAYKLKTVEYTANKGKKDTKRQVTFIANRGKKWKEGAKNRGMHRASAPGEAPAIRSGAYRKGITYVITKKAPMSYVATVGVSRQSGRGTPTKSGRSIAHMLEWGTKYMKPRPGWRISIDKWKRGYKALLAPKKKRSAPNKG